MQETKFSFLKRVWPLVAPYWRSQEKWSAYFLLIAIVGLNLTSVYINVRYNMWQNGFYDALQNYDLKAFKSSMIAFCYIATAAIITSVYANYLGGLLSLRWRRWLTKTYLDRWLHKQNYYHMELTNKPTDNPDQRISEDIRGFIDSTLGLSLGMLNAIVTLFSFLMILWHLSGPLDFHVYGVAIHIPGYMVWTALIYSVGGTWLTMRIGRPLIMLNFNQQRFEADFRFSMVRLRENSENIAFYRGEVEEKTNFMQRFYHVFGNYWALIKRQKALNWFTNFYFQAAIIFPFLVLAPRYFAKKLQLGDVMQIMHTFGQVQGALSYLVSAYSDIANWKATTDRLVTFTDTMCESEMHPGFKPTYSSRPVLEAKNLKINLPDHSPLLQKIDLCLAPGDSILITGPSGCGKTTLLRTLAGIWPFAEGSVLLPETAKLMFLPQRAYLPLGTLKQVLIYPNVDHISDEKVLEILSLCKLEHLCGRLHEGSNWAQVLSQGEQQRVGFARAILTQPDFLFLDEATSALDEALERYLYELLKAKCPKACLISVGHRETLKQWHATEWSCAAHNARTTTTHFEPEPPPPCLDAL